MMRRKDDDVERKSCNVEKELDKKRREGWTN
jgi:hypothetical protein